MKLGVEKSDDDVIWIVTRVIGNGRSIQPPAEGAHIFVADIGNIGVLDAAFNCRGERAFPSLMATDSLRNFLLKRHCHAYGVYDDLRPAESG